MNIGMCLDVDKCTTLADIQFIHIYKGHKLKRNSSLANHRRRPRLKTTTKGHRHSDQHSNCFRGNIGEHSKGWSEHAAFLQNRHRWPSFKRP